jgi:hypothetical protein
VLEVNPQSLGNGLFVFGKFPHPCNKGKPATNTKAFLWKKNGPKSPCYEEKKFNLLYLDDRFYHITKI